jgi:pimeloyl-ACP methyl ester carboxylesterase
LAGVETNVSALFIIDQINMLFRFVLLLASALPLLAEGARINYSEAVEIGGIKQWVKFQGDDDHAPVLLFLHGGPGNSVMSYADRFTGALQKNFIVVHWDQRESGQTAVLNKSTAPLSVSLFINDAIELINFLRSKFDQDKIYLMGHSWGGYLGLRVVVEKPELLHAYFALSPMIHQLESERITLHTLREKAVRENDEQAAAELKAVEIPFKNAEQLFYHRKWLSKLMNTTTPSHSKVEQWGKTWLTLFNEASKTNFADFAPELNCPVYFLIGTHDFQTHYSLAESYYEKVVCKEKKLYWFTDSAHNPHLTETTKFQKIVISHKK